MREIGQSAVRWLKLLLVSAAGAAMIGVAPSQVEAFGLPTPRIVRTVLRAPKRLAQATGRALSFERDREPAGLNTGYGGWDGSASGGYDSPKKKESGGWFSSLFKPKPEPGPSKTMEGFLGADRPQP